MFKKYCITFISIVLVCLLAGAGTVFSVDPFNHYRADADLKNIIYQYPLYQNIGIAQHAQYDTLVTGSSMAANFRAWWFDELFGCSAVRLAFDGGFTPEFRTLLQTAIAYNPQLKTVFMSLDNYLLTRDTELANKTVSIPDWQTDNNPLTDVNYLLNKDVLLNNIRTYFSYKALPSYDFYEMNAWDTNPKYVFSKQYVLNEYHRIPEEPAKPASLFDKQAGTFLTEMLPIIRDNPQIRFVFFAPPYSILYWDDQRNAGTLDATIHAMQTVYGELLKLENVRLFYFQDEIEKITELDMYRDYSHYCAQYNRWMAESMKSGEHEITSDTYVQTLQHAKQMFTEYEYDAIFQ